jgi:hypothetical protein
MIAFEVKYDAAWRGITTSTINLMLTSSVINKEDTNFLINAKFALYDYEYYPSRQEAEEWKNTYLPRIKEIKHKYLLR